MTDPVALVRESYRAFNERDFDTLRAMYTPDTVWSGEDIAGWPGDPVYIGHEGLEKFIDEWWGTWEEMRTIPLEIEAGANGVFVLCRCEGRARGGVDIRWDLGQVVYLGADGRVERVSHHTDIAAARAAAGL